MSQVVAAVMGYDLFSLTKTTDTISSVVFPCENREGEWEGYFHRSNLGTDASKEQGSVAFLSLVICSSDGYESHSNSIQFDSTPFLKDLI